MIMKKHIIRFLTASLVLMIPGAVDAVLSTDGQTGTDSAEAFQSGINTGQQAFDETMLTNAATAESLPGYNTNPPETQYTTQDNTANAEAAGIAKQSTSDAYNISITSKQGVDQNVTLTTGTDPLFQQTGPQSSLSGQFSGCSDVIGTTPGETTTQTCTATPPSQKVTCSKALIVDVTKTPSCNLGSNLASIQQRYAWRSSGSTRFCYSNTTIACGPALDGFHQVSLYGWNSWGAGSIGLLLNAATPGVQWRGMIGGCMYSVASNGCDANGTCTASVYGGNTASATFPLSRIITRITDTINNSCAAVEARVTCTDINPDGCVGVGTGATP